MKKKVQHKRSGPTPPSKDRKGKANPSRRPVLQPEGTGGSFDRLSALLGLAVLIMVMTRIPSVDQWLEKTVYASGEKVVEEIQKTVDSIRRQPEKEEKKAEDFDPLILVNAWHKLPDHYEVDPVALATEYEQSVDRHCYDAAVEMLEDCRAAGNDVTVCSSYRSHEKQVQLFQEETKKYLNQGEDQETAERKAGTAVAIPGTSEHELGLAMDIVDKSYQLLDKGQENTPTQKWLMENSYKYGFILRYPNKKKKITGIIYEPWHYRYVGKEAAAYIYDHQLCLEEYLQAQEN